MYSKTFLISVRNVAPEHKIQKLTFQEVLVRFFGLRSSLIFFDFRLIRWVHQHPEFLENKDLDRSDT